MAFAAPVCDCIRNGQPAGAVGYACTGERKYVGTDTHIYDNFLWWGGKTCTMKVYQSGTLEGCSKCGFVYGLTGQHDCYVVHQNCGKGGEKVCTVGFPLPDYDKRSNFVPIPEENSVEED